MYIFHPHIHISNIGTAHRLQKTTTHTHTHTDEEWFVYVAANTTKKRWSAPKKKQGNYVYMNKKVHLLFFPLGTNQIGCCCCCSCFVEFNEYRIPLPMLNGRGTIIVRYCWIFCLWTVRMLPSRIMIKPFRIIGDWSSPQRLFFSFRFVSCKESFLLLAIVPSPTDHNEQ
jgi:hypothetical protein